MAHRGARPVLVGAIDAIVPPAPAELGGGSLNRVVARLMGVAIHLEICLGAAASPQCVAPATHTHMPLRAAVATSDRRMVRCAGPARPNGWRGHGYRSGAAGLWQSQPTDCWASTITPIRCRAYPWLACPAAPQPPPRPAHCVPCGRSIAWTMTCRRPSVCMTMGAPMLPLCPHPRSQPHASHRVVCGPTRCALGRPVCPRRR